MRGRRHLLRASTATVAGALILSGAIPGMASAGTKSQTATLSGFAQKVTLTPTCPRGQRATGGGFSNSPYSPTGSPYLHESQKSGQRAWRVSANTDGGTVLVTAYAYCSADAPKTATRSAALTAPPGVPSSADATCGSKGNAQAGGLLTTPYAPLTPLASAFDSLRLGKKTWHTRFIAGGGPASATSYAYCAKEKPPTARSGSITTAIDANVTAISADCKRGTKPVAGGFSAPDSDAAAGFFNVSQSFRSGKHWQVTAKHSGGLPRTLTAIAYCG